MVSSKGITRYGLMGLSAVAIWVGSCGPGNQATLTILEPMDGALLTLATDTRSDIAGVQTSFTVQAVGVAVGDRVDLILEDDSIVGTETVPDSGEILFADVTLPSGQHTIVAATRTTDIRSTPITVEVQDDCATIDFVTPAPVGSRVTFGPADDTDGEACAGSFETTVVIATDAGNGATARVFVNDVPRTTTTVTGTTARFEGVAFDIGSMPNRLRVEVTNSDGVACQQTFGPEIYVDCEGVSCRITAPVTTGAFLNQSHDVSDADGFQGDFEVTTDADGAGQAVRLVIDGNETDALSAMPTMMGTDGVASFGNVPLSEGVHRIQAICSDAAGNPTRTSAEWTVDITPCGVAIATPTEGALFNDTDDLDSGTDGIQIDLDGDASGDACTMVRTGHCSSLPDFGSFGGASFSSRVTLGTAASQELCAQVQDEAGNVGEARVNIRVRTDAPQLEIVSPTTGTGYNASGTGGRTADAQPSSSTCEAAFTVNCTDLGSTVTLIRESTGATFVGGTATCEAAAGLPAPYTGQATFASVSLPSIESLGSLSVRARSEVDRLVGLSDPIMLLSDCEAPVISVSRPTCGSTLRPTDDEDSGTAGVQYRVDVLNTNVPKPPVTLELRNSSGTVVYGPVTSSTPATGITTSFAGTTFVVGGDVTIDVCASDAAGNNGCHSCSVSVQDIPTLNITEPSAGAVLSSASDCDTGRAGLQLRVRATTNADPGSPATVQVGAASPNPTSVSGTSIDVCVDAADGRDVPITVTVTDAVRGMASATVRVNIDTMAPSGAIDDLVVSEADRRGGVARFSWTAVDDAGGLRLDHYEARCAAAPITNETEWAAATPITITTTPGMAGAMQSTNVMGFRPGHPRHCVIRGADIAGQLTPLPSTPPAPYEPVLLEHDVTGLGTGQLGTAIVPVGDVNGDGIDDLLASALDGNVYLYFGSASATPLSGTPNVTFAGPTAGGYGRVLGSLGDLNGDGIGDFGISARGATVGGVAQAGAVWIVFGRPASSTWPATVSLSTTSCGADVCLFGTEAGALLGWSLASAGDFDGDGFGDAAIGAFGATAGAGKQYVVLGGAFTSGTTFSFPDTAPTPMNPDSFVIAAPSGAASMGESATAPGDFRGSDGRTDLVLGASGNATMSIQGRVYTLAGRAFPGGMSGLVTIAATELTEVASGSAGTFGRLVRAIGDYDGNGRVDIAVYNATSIGQVTVYLQGASGFSASSSFTVTNDASSSTGDFLGSTLGTGFHPFLGRLGDLDGDAMTDLLLGSVQRGAATAGGVDLFYGTGSPAALVRSAADLMLEPTEAGTSRVAAYVGDINGDGFNDILIGDPGYMSNAGRLRLIY